MPPLWHPVCMTIKCQPLENSCCEPREKWGKLLWKPCYKTSNINNWCGSCVITSPGITLSSCVCSQSLNSVEDVRAAKGRQSSAWAGGIICKASLVCFPACWGHWARQGISRQWAGHRQDSDTARLQKGCGAGAGPSISHCSHTIHLPLAGVCYLPINGSMELQAYYAQSGLDYSTY